MNEAELTTMELIGRYRAKLRAYNDLIMIAEEKNKRGDLKCSERMITELKADKGKFIDDLIAAMWKFLEKDLTEEETNAAEDLMIEALSMVRTPVMTRCGYCGAVVTDADSDIMYLDGAAICQDCFKKTLT